MDQGRCPGCDETGPLLERCMTRACSKAGYHFVPEAYAARGESLADPDIGRTLGTAIDGFVLVDFLGAGNFGRVFLALDGEGQAVALKQFFPQGVADDAAVTQARDSFGKEAKALASLDHHHVVRFVGYSEKGVRPWLAMEYIAGGRSLQLEISTRGKAGQGFAPHEVAAWLQALCSALGAAHACNIVHRDIKPANIMLAGEEGALLPKLVDFGLAKFVDEGSRTQHLAGTVRFMAPEQFTGKKIGPWTDLYALACVAVELMTNHKVYAGLPPEEIQRRKGDPGHDPLAKVQGLGAAERQFFKHALAFDWKDRWQSAGEFWKALAPLVQPKAQVWRAREGSDLAGLLDDSERRELERLRKKEHDLEDAQRAQEGKQAQMERELAELRALVAGQAGGHAQVRPGDSGPRPDNGDGTVATFRRKSAAAPIAGGVVLLLGIGGLVAWSMRSAAPAEGPAVGAEAASAELGSGSAGGAVKPAPANSDSAGGGAADPDAAPVESGAAADAGGVEAMVVRDAAVTAPAFVSGHFEVDPAAGSVFDVKTKLTWMRGVGPQVDNLEDAKAFCAAAPTAGDRWRLPELFELQSLVEGTRPPLLDTAAFEMHADGATTRTQWQYWTADTTGNGRFRLGFHTRDARALDGPGHVRCVRGTWSRPVAVPVATAKASAESAPPVAAKVPVAASRTAPGKPVGSGAKPAAPVAAEPDNLADEAARYVSLAQKANTAKLKILYLQKALSRAPGNAAYQKLLKEAEAELAAQPKPFAEAEPPPPPVKTGAELYKEARDAMLSGESDKAIGLFLQATKAGYGKAHGQLARVYFQKSDKAACAKHAKAYLDKYPDAGDAVQIESMLEKCSN